MYYLERSESLKFWLFHDDDICFRRCFGNLLQVIFTLGRRSVSSQSIVSSSKSLGNEDVFENENGAQTTQSQLVYFRMRSKTTGGSGYEIGSDVTKTTGRCALLYRFPRILLSLRSFSVLCTIAAYNCFCHQWLPKRRISKSNSSVRFAWSSTKNRRCCLACTLTARNVYRSM